MIMRHGRLEEAGGEYVRRYARRARADLTSALTALTKLAVEQVAGIDHAGVTLVISGGSIRCLAATDGHTHALDNIQRACRQGPCLDAAVNQQVFRVDDLTSESRWPEFTPRAVACTPVRALLAFPVLHDGTAHAALNLYADRPGAFDAEVQAAGASIASRMVDALCPAQPCDEPARSTHTDTIDQAKTLLMRRFSIDVAQAFALMVKLAKQRNESIEAVARELVSARR
jgi:putative methionine-R-sulfoxide reductase with GAF domain